MRGKLQPYDYVIVKGKKLYFGYTTGASAAAAARGAALMLKKQVKIAEVSMKLYSGHKLTVPLDNIMLEKDQVSCAVVKDGGDDPDITTGLKIYAAVRFKDKPGISLRGGKGVGIVLEPGLQLKIGEPAINPVPRKMIREAVKGIFPEDTGLTIEISVPGGKEVAKRTLNPRLGIKDGISILGTTGVVVPMSEDAFKDSIVLELKKLKNENKGKVVLVPGNYGREMAMNKFAIAHNDIIEMSNYVGYVLEHAVDLGFRDILIVGHLGKLIKVAGGIFNTHSRVADGRNEIMAGIAAYHGVSQSVILDIFAAKTTEKMVDDLYKIDKKDIFPWIAERVVRRIKEYLRKEENEVNIEVLLYSFHQGVIGTSKGFDNLLSYFISN